MYALPTVGHASVMAELWQNNVNTALGAHQVTSVVFRLVQGTAGATSKQQAKTLYKLHTLDKFKSES